MVTLILIISMIILSIIFVIASQYFIGSIVLTLCYAVCMLIGCISYQLKMKRKQDKTTQKLLELFDKVYYTQDFNDHDLSVLEHKLYTLVKSNTTIIKRISDEKERMNSLISDVAHQIKTPLANIIMYSDMLLEDNQMNHANAEKIRSQAEKLRFLFDAMIKMSRCESGLITGNLHRQTNHVKELLAKAVTDIYPKAEEKNIAIYTNCDASLTAYFDMKWTTEAVFNVLENAVKYSPPCSSIQINVHMYELFIRIDICDKGVGITEEEQQNIWQRFYRGSNVIDESGVGIGLYLTKQILINEHGYVKVRSGLGEGSTFSVFIPIHSTEDR